MGSSRPWLAAWASPDVCLEPPPQVVILALLAIICCVCYLVAGRGGGRDERHEFTADVDAWDERGYRDEVELTSNYKSDYGDTYGETSPYENKGFA